MHYITHASSCYDALTVTVYVSGICETSEMCTLHNMYTIIIALYIWYKPECQTYIHSAADIPNIT